MGVWSPASIFRGVCSMHYAEGGGGLNFVKLFRASPPVYAQV